MAGRWTGLPSCSRIRPRQGPDGSPPVNPTVLEFEEIVAWGARTHRTRVVRVAELRQGVSADPKTKQGKSGRNFQEGQGVDRGVLSPPQSRRSRPARGTHLCDL